MDNLTASLLAKKKGGSLLVEEVFSTYLYEGTGATQTITNGIDLAGEGGMVWAKSRDSAFNHFIHDTERGLPSWLETNTTAAENATSNYAVSSFNSDGFSLFDGGQINGAGAFSSWTFRKAPRFFDVVTYTGDGVAGREIAHGLGVVPGMIIVKRLDAGAADWQVYHRGNTASPETDYLVLNTTAATADDISKWNDTAPTDSVFSLGVSTNVNEDAITYVAYLFAHDPLGSSGDGSDGMIACGSYVEGASGASISLGWEPQFILLKQSSTGTSPWYMIDTMRGIVTDGTDYGLQANDVAAEISLGDSLNVTADGFDTNTLFGSGDTVIYMAIRRPMGAPESAGEVFDSVARSGTGASATLTSGFVTDMVLSTSRSNVSHKGVWDRLRGAGKYLYTSSTGAEAGAGVTVNRFDLMDGVEVGDDASTGTINISGRTFSTHQFKRAPGFFDVVAYEWNGTATRDVDHGLTVPPEMLWVKRRNSAVNWAVWHSDFAGTTGSILLNSTAAESASGVFTSGDPDSSTFPVASDSSVNASGGTYIAYLFATLPGISKVGSFTGNGTTQVINCGFTAGARFVLIKSTTDTGNWLFWDSVRGIVAGNDPHLAINSTAAEITINDSIDPDNSGFVVNLDAGAAVLDQININGKEYIYYAVS